MHRPDSRSGGAVCVAKTQTRLQKPGHAVLHSLWLQGCGAGRHHIPLPTGGALPWRCLPALGWRHVPSRCLDGGHCLGTMATESDVFQPVFTSFVSTMARLMCVCMVFPCLGDLCSPSRVLWSRVAALPTARSSVLQS